MISFRTAKRTIQIGHEIMNYLEPPCKECSGTRKVSWVFSALLQIAEKVEQVLKLDIVNWGACSVNIIGLPKNF